MTPEQIKRLRIYQLHLTQRQMAERLQVHRVTLARWESGQAAPTSKYLRQLQKWQQGRQTAEGGQNAPSNG